MEQYQGIVGLFVVIGIAWSCCENRQAIQWRHVAAGLALQAVLAVLLVCLPVSQSVFIWLNRAVLALEQATTAGTTMVFGYLGGASLPFPEAVPGSAYVLAFRALPLVLVVSAIS